MNMWRCAGAIAIVSLLSSSAMAATFIVPDDETFIRKADVIVTGIVLDSHVQYADGGGIETIYRIAVDDVLKGMVEDSVVEVREWGGVIGSRFMVASGTPDYEIGQRYLIFMTPFRDGRLTTLDFALGQFRFVIHQGQQILERDRREILDLSERGLPFEREARSFLNTIQDQVGQELAWSADSRTVLAPTANDLDHSTAINIGIGQWSSGSIVSYSFGGTPASNSVKDPFDSESKIIIDDPNGVIAGTFNGSGTLAVAFFGGSGAGDHLNITGADIVVQDGVRSATLSQSAYNTMMTHELGHTLGFRHSNQNKFSQDGTSCDPGFPCSTSAVMNSTASGSFNGNLQVWDQDGKQANFASSSSFDANYLTHQEGDGRAWHRDSPSANWRLWVPVSCTGPTITAQPTANPSTITSGQSSTLSVSASAGTGSPSYQWYRGSKGQTGSPVSGGTSASISVSPTSSQNYWVRVTDGCSSVDSNAVTVNVQAGCTGPSISQPIANPSTINQGGSSTLSVSASASEGSLTYQWFVGSSGQTGNPISGATVSSVSVSPTISTSYWVRVTDGCNGGTSRNSNTVTVTVCVPPTITSQPQDTSVESGKSVILSTSASGTSPVIRWYRGNLGDTSTLLTTSSSVSVSPTTDTKYWARASSSCGQADTRQVTVVVVGQCVPPQITQQPQPATIEAGGTATFTVGVTGTTLSYQWYEVRGGGTELVPISGANAATYTTPPLTATTAYLVQVTNSCGQANSNQILVTVSQCSPPTITSQPQDVSVRGSERVVLGVGATGSDPLVYQWFEGQSGTPSIAINFATSSTLEITASETKSYWVRVRNDCGEVNSVTATVTVESRRRRSVRRR